MTTMVHARVEDIARDVFGDDAIVLADDTVVAEVPGWDSLGHVNFMHSLEEEFGVRFNHDEYAGYSSVGELKRMLERKLGVP